MRLDVVRPMFLALIVSLSEAQSVDMVRWERTPGNLVSTAQRFQVRMNMVPFTPLGCVDEKRWVPTDIVVPEVSDPWALEPMGAGPYGGYTPGTTVRKVIEHTRGKRRVTWTIVVDSLETDDAHTAMGVCERIRDRLQYESSAAVLDSVGASIWSTGPCIELPQQFDAREISSAALDVFLCLSTETPGYPETGDAANAIDWINFVDLRAE